MFTIVVFFTYIGTLSFMQFDVEYAELPTVVHPGMVQTHTCLMSGSEAKARKNGIKLVNPEVHLQPWKLTNSRPVIISQANKVILWEKC